MSILQIGEPGERDHFVMIGDSFSSRFTVEIADALQDLSSFTVDATVYVRDVLTPAILTFDTTGSDLLNGLIVYELTAAETAGLDPTVAHDYRIRLTSGAGAKTIATGRFSTGVP